MEVEIRIPASLLRFTADTGTVVGQGESVGEAIDSLSQMYDGIREEIIDDSGEIRHGVAIHLNDEDVNYIDGLNTSVREGDIISIDHAPGA